jgi:hypothetical protein
MGSRSLSLFVVVIFVAAALDFGQIPERGDVSAHALAMPQQQQQLIFHFKAASL